MTIKIQQQLALSTLLLLPIHIQASEADAVSQSQDTAIAAEDQQHDEVAANQMDVAGLGLDFEEVVITGTRTEQLLMDSPVRVEVISREVIERQHALELSEAVQTISGLAVRPIRGKEGREAWMQGISANRVLVLVDGEEVSASTGSTIDLTQISTGDISRVEVVKGATSVLYGSAAMAGVINVITAEPLMGLHYKVAVDGGSYGDKNASGKSEDIARKRLNTHVSYRNDHWTVTGGINARYSDGFAADPDHWDRQGADGHKINNRLAVRYTADNDDYYQISHEYYDQEQLTRYTDRKANNFFNVRKRDDAVRHHTTIKSLWHMNDSDLTLYAYKEDYENDSIPGLTTRRIAEFDSAKANLQWNSYHLENHTLTIGSDFFTESLNQDLITSGVRKSEVDDESRDNIEIYAQDEIELGSLTLLPGLRWQNDSDFGQKYTPKINFRWDVASEGETEFFIRGGVGKGYRVSNLKERHYIFDHSHLGYIIIGNPDLQPESSTSYQLAFVLSDHKNYQFDINFFRNELDDLIETIFSRQDGAVSVYQYGNIEKALTQGIEVNGSYSINDVFRIRSGYVFLHAIDESTDLRLKDRPKNQVKTVLDYDTSFGLGINFIASWQSSEIDRERPAGNQKSPSWSKFDIKLNQEITEQLSLYGGINNFTNTQRDFYDGYDNRPVEGRLVYLGFKLQH